MTDEYQEIYMVVMTDGPMLILRLPYDIERHKIIPSWANVVKAVSYLLHGYFRLPAGCDVKVSSLARPDDEKTGTIRLLYELDAAFRTIPHLFPRYWLYQWSPNGFNLARRMTSGCVIVD